MGPRMSCQNCGTVKLDKLSQIKYVRLVFLEDWIQDKVDEEVDAGIENQQEFGEGSKDELPKLGSVKLD